MRIKHFISSLFLLGALTIIGAGCGQKTPAPSPSPANRAAPTNAAPVSDECGNPYYPFKPGLAIAYRVSPTTGAAGGSDYTIRTVGVNGTVATVRAETAGGGSADMEADCANGSVALKGSSGLDAAVGGTKFKTTVLSSSGTSMPANLAPGATWNHSETIKMEMTSGTVAGMDTITMTTTEQGRAVGQESVTVPAGTYDAMKIELTRTTASKFSGTPSGMKIPEMPPDTTTATEWWVKGIGMVKSVTVDKGQTSTVEAKSVTGQ
jgi:hypothetical protein